MAHIDIKLLDVAVCAILSSIKHWAVNGKKNTKSHSAPLNPPGLVTRVLPWGAVEGPSEHRPRE